MSSHEQKVNLDTLSKTLALYIYDQVLQLSSCGLGTLPLVLFGVFRYLGLVYQRGEGGSPTQVVLKDRGIQVVLVLYLALCVTLIQQEVHLDLMSTQSIEGSINK